MNFDELGAALRAERERRGLRIEDVADHLKISARHLRALEEGDAAALPHPAYARGFIRSYAAYLGMSPEEIHDALNGVSTPKAAPQAPVQLSEPAQRPQRGGGGGKGALLILVLLIVAAGAYAGWRWGLPLLAGLEQQRLAQPSPPLTSAQPAPEPVKRVETGQAEASRSARPAPSVPAQPAAQAEKPSPQATAPRAEAAQKAPTPSRQEQQNTAAPAPGASTGSAAEAPPQAAGAQTPDEAAAPGQHKVIITATEECWIHSNADKTDTRQFSLRKGDTFALTFARSLELKLGNAGGVQIRYDGRPMPAAGQSGQVRTLTFPPQDGQ